MQFINRRRGNIKDARANGEHTQIAIVKFETLDRETKFTADPNDSEAWTR